MCSGGNSCTKDGLQPGAAFVVAVLIAAAFSACVKQLLAIALRPLVVEQKLVAAVITDWFGGVFGQALWCGVFLVADGSWVVYPPPPVGF